MRQPHPTTSQNGAITALILAGGEGRRLGQKDKGLVELDGRPLISYVLEAISPQVGAVIISANRNLARYHAFGVPVIEDRQSNFQGPLAGMAAAITEARTPYLLTLPCDSPFVPPDLAARMYATLQQEQSELCLARDPQRLQPLFALFSTDLADDLSHSVAAGKLKVEKWMTRHRYSVVEETDPWRFFNINTPADLAAAKAHLDELRAR